MTGAARDLQAEQDHAEWHGWMDAQGYDFADDSYQAEAFAAGMQAERDLAATPAQPAPVSPHPGCAVCASGVTVPHGAGGTPGQAGPKSEANWTCEFCPAKFADLSHAEQHVRIEHPNAAVEDENVFELAAILAGNPHATNPDLARIILADPRFARQHEVQPAHAAAQEPHAAPGLATVRAELTELTEDVNGGDEAAESLAEQYVRWLEAEREQLLSDARERELAKPAPELADARDASDLEVALIIAERNQLRMVLQRLADDGNLEVRDRLAAIRPELTRTESGAAPELAVAMRETKSVLDLLDDFTHAVIDLDDGRQAGQYQQARRSRQGHPHESRAAARGGQVNEDQMYDAAEREMDLYRAEITRITAERDDYAARLRATDQSWTELAAERDDLRKLVAEILDDFWPGPRFEGISEGLRDAQARVDAYRQRAKLDPM